MDFDTDLKELQDLLKSVDENAELTKEELMAALEKSKTDEEKSEAILGLLKAKTGGGKPEMETEEEEEEEGEEEGEGKMKGKKGGGGTYKSMLDDLPEEEQSAFDATPIIKSMMDSIDSLRKEISSLKKSKDEEMKFVKSIAKVVSGSSEMIKSVREEVDFISGLPATMKGQFLSYSKEQKDRLQKAAIDRFSVGEGEKQESVTPQQLQTAMTKAYQEGKGISLIDITTEGNAGYSGITLSPEKKEIVKSYFSK